MRRDYKGLTLIEVLIIVVMIGILLTLALQRFRERNHPDAAATVRADIERVQAAEVTYFGAHHSFGSRAQLDSAKLLEPSVTNTVTITITSTGYTAMARNDDDRANPRSCSLEVTGGAEGASRAKPSCT